jgi:hypothetical protein
MKLPSSNRELKAIFIQAEKPDISEFSGEYIVDMLTVFPSFKKFSHRKVFYAENNRVSGFNILFSKRWGQFYLAEGICEKVNSVNVVEINYNVAGNSFIIRKIRDHIRCVVNGALYLGRFNYLLKGKPRFLGYFSLSKMK